MSKPTIAAQFEERLTALIDNMRDARRGIFGHDNSLYLLFSDGSVITDIALTGRKDTTEDWPADEIAAFTAMDWEEFTDGGYDWSIG